MAHFVDVLVSAGGSTSTSAQLFVVVSDRQPPGRFVVEQDKILVSQRITCGKCLQAI